MINRFVLQLSYLPIILWVVGLPTLAFAAPVGETISTINAFDLQQRIESAIHEQASSITIPAGIYHMSHALRVVGANNFIIKGAGAGRTILIFPSPKGGIFVQQSHGITLDGFSIDFSPLPFTEGVITSAKHIIGNRWFVKFTIEPGYPPLTMEQREHPYMFYYFDRSTKRELEHVVMSRGPVQVLNPMEGRLLAAAHELNSGDYVVLKQQKLPGFGLWFNNDSDITIKDVEIESSPSLAVGAHYVSGDNNFSYKILPGPMPPGASLQRLISTNADGIQWFWSPGNVTFNHCNFGELGDDGIHIRSFATKIVEIINSRSVVIEDPIPENIFAPPFESFATKGKVSIERPGDRMVLGHVKISKAIGIKVPEKMLEFKFGGIQKHYARLSLKSSLPPSTKVGDLVAFENLNPHHYLIENSSFHNTRARGLLLQASNGEIINNQFFDIELSAIEVRLEGPYDCCHDKNIRIINNKIRHVMYGLIVGTPTSNHLAAININDPGNNKGITSHRNIIIEKNIIDGSGVAGIFVDATDKLIITNNIISNINLDAGLKAGRKWGRYAAAAISIMDSKKVVVDNNKISRMGRYSVGPVRIIH